MKKVLLFIIGVTIVTTLFSCASNPGTASGAKQARDAGRPGWATASTVFFKSSMREKLYPEAPDTGEKGWYASGQDNFGEVNASSAAARLNARAELARKIADQINATSEVINKGNNEKSTGSYSKDKVENFLVGSMPVDNFVTEDGTVYVLMFISFDDFDKSVKKTDDENLKKIVKQMELEMELEQQKE